MATKTTKISVYLSPELDETMKLLARYDDMSITELVTLALQGYIANREDDINFQRQQEKARTERKQQQ